MNYSTIQKINPVSGCSRGAGKLFSRSTATVAALSLLLAAAATSTVCADGIRTPHGFNRPGNILIADQFNNRVIEIDPGGHIIWSFGRGPNDFSPHSIIGCNDAQRVGNY